MLLVLSALAAPSSTERSKPGTPRSQGGAGTRRPPPSTRPRSGRVEVLAQRGERLGGEARFVPVGRVVDHEAHVALPLEGGDVERREREADELDRGDPVLVAPPLLEASDENRISAVQFIRFALS